MKQQTVMHVRKQALFWTAALAAFLGFLWLFDDILLPFIAGMALAYFLDPVADFFESRGISRMWSTVLITLLLLVLFILSMAILIPVLVNQLTGFLERLPQLVNRLQELIASTENKWIRDRFGIDGKTL